jgi:hypothetical protein
MEKKPHSVTLQLVREECVKGLVPGWQTLPARVHLEGPEVQELYSRLAEARLALPELVDNEYVLIRTGADPDIKGLTVA